MGSLQWPHRGLRVGELFTWACYECRPVIDLNEYSGNREGAWVYSGDTTAQGNRASGTCGGEGKDEVFRFAAAVGGRYSCGLMDYGDTDANSVLYARRYCGSAEQAAELVCNDAPGEDDVGSLSRIRFHLDPGETVYIFVDGFARVDVLGPYTLSCVLEEAPLDDPAECIADEESSMPAGGEEAAGG